MIKGLQVPPDFLKAGVLHSLQQPLSSTAFR